MKESSQLGVLAQAIAVPPDVDDVTVVDQAIDQGRGHDVVAKDLAPFIEALVAGEHGSLGSTVCRFDGCGRRSSRYAGAKPSARTRLGLRRCGRRRRECLLSQFRSERRFPVGFERRVDARGRKFQDRLLG